MRFPKNSKMGEFDMSHFLSVLSAKLTHMG